MSEEPGLEFGPDCGQRRFGPLSVQWQQLGNVPLEVELQLCLGAQRSDILLNRQQDRMPFYLNDGDEQVAGEVALVNGVEATLLVIEFADGDERLPVDVISWRVCDPCSSQPPREGRRSISPRLVAHWTISGATQACLNAELTLTNVDGESAQHEFSPDSPRWCGQLPCEDARPEVNWDLTWSLDSGGEASIRGVIGDHGGLGPAIALARFQPGPPIPPQPDPEHDGETVIIGARSAEDFSSFTYPRGLKPITPRQFARRFYALLSGSGFQSQLIKDHASKDGAGMLEEAADFVAPASKKYPNQYVSDIEKLPEPMNRLCGQPLADFLDSEPEGPDEFLNALLCLFDLKDSKAVVKLATSKPFLQTMTRLQDSVTALLVIGSAPVEHEQDLSRALIGTHALTLEAAPESPFQGPLSYTEPMSANSVMSTKIFPVPPAGSSSKLNRGGAKPVQEYVRPLGVADLKVITQRLVRYQLGELAHIENVMGRERKERNVSHDQRISAQDESTEQFDDQNGVKRDSWSNSEEQEQNSSLATLKRTFDDLKQDYGSDGLSVTVTGGWTDACSTPAQETASRSGRTLLEQARQQFSKKIHESRQAQSVQRVIRKEARSFVNTDDTEPVVGQYRWVDEIYWAHTRDLGPRLMVEFILASPAADFVERCEKLLSLELNPPLKPTQGDAKDQVHWAGDVTPENYVTLAARYGSGDLPPPPQTSISRSVNLSASAPADSGMLILPDGYQAQSALVGYVVETASSGTGKEASPASLTVLVAGHQQTFSASQTGGSAQTITLASETGALSVAANAEGAAFQASVEVIAQLDTSSDYYRDWQNQVYQSLWASYRTCLERFRTDALAAFQVIGTSSGERGLDAKQTLLKRGAIETLVDRYRPGLPVSPPHGGWIDDVLNFQLIPFFEQALDWSNMTYSLYPDYFGPDQSNQRPAWLLMQQWQGNHAELYGFLSAASARLLVAVNSVFTLPMLYFLSSNGRFWFGASGLTPVHERDVNRVNQFKSAYPEIPLDESGWEVRMPTTMVMLDQSSELPAFETGS